MIFMWSPVAGCSRRARINEKANKTVFHSRNRQNSLNVLPQEYAS